MVRFLPFDRTDDEGINIVLQHIDFSIQYGEDLEFKEPKVGTVCVLQFMLISQLGSTGHSENSKDVLMTGYINSAEW